MSVHKRQFSKKMNASGIEIIYGYRRYNYIFSVIEENIYTTPTAEHGKLHQEQTGHLNC